MRKLILGLAILLVCQFGVVAQVTPVIKNLKTELLQNPIGLDVSTPRFSWELISSERGAKQTAYEITVSTGKNGLDPIWNSGKIESDHSINIKYAGAALAPSTRYYWQVNVWDNSNTTIASTENAYFETGLLDSGWGAAQWIKATTLKQGEIPEDETDPTAITDYTIKMDFEISDIAAGPCFAARDANNFFMWQINIETGRTRLRPHSWLNGGGANHENKDIDKVDISFMNIEGKVVYGRKSCPQTFSVDMKGYPSGMYMISTLINKITHKNKIIKN